MLRKGAYMENDRAEEWALRPRPDRKPNYIEGQSPAFPCPHCGGRGHARTSERLSRMVRKLYYRCFNPECTMRWTAHLEFISVTQPSLRGPLPGAVPLLPLKDRPPPNLHAG